MRGILIGSQEETESLQFRGTRTTKLSGLWPPVSPKGLLGNSNFELP
jgi:hypothetical protein